MGTRGRSAGPSPTNKPNHNKPNHKVASSARASRPPSRLSSTAGRGRLSNTAGRLRGFVARHRRDAGARQALIALLISSGGDLIAGITLGALTHTLADLPGLLVLVPAAIGMRGNIFGSLGSRLGTAFHTGTFELSASRDSVVGQNVWAAACLSIAISGVLAVLAKVVAVGFGLPNTIAIHEFLVVSVLGGVLSSSLVLAITLLVARTAARREWDLDSVSAPIVTAAGDIVTLPSLWLAAHVIEFDVAVRVLGVLLGLVCVGVAVLGIRSKREILGRVVRESIPVLVIAGAVDVVAGLTIEKRVESFLALPALLVMIPPFLEDTGALGAILTSRLSTKLHLGIIDPTGTPQAAARSDFALVGALAVPVFLLVGLSAQLAATVAGKASPGVIDMVAISMLGGAIATSAAIAAGYYASVGSYRLGLDPDNHGIPLVTSAMDLAGAFALVIAMVVVGVG